MTNELRTGDLVLCKVGSFPPWPAVVFPQRLLRNDVYRKRRPNCVAVCFFNDPTYYWEQPRRLNRLDSSTIEDFLSQNIKAKSQQDLLKAYKQARDYTSLSDFIVDRFKEEDRFDELQLEMGDEEIKAGEDPYLSKNHSRKQKSSSSASSVSLSPSPSLNGKRKHSKVDEDALTQELDEKLEEKGYKSGGKTAHNKRKHVHSGNNENNNNGIGKRSTLDRSRRIEISLLFRRRLQKNLVQREDPPTQEEISESHKMLGKICDNIELDPPFFDLEALRQSKLHKLLKVIVNDTNLGEFHPICKKILIRWEDFISELKAEKMKREQDGSETPK